MSDTLTPANKQKMLKSTKVFLGIAVAALLIGVGLIVAGIVLLATKKKSSSSSSFSSSSHLKIEEVSEPKKVEIEEIKEEKNDGKEIQVSAQIEPSDDKIIIKPVSAENDFAGYVEVESETPLILPQVPAFAMKARTMGDLGKFEDEEAYQKATKLLAFDDVEFAKFR